MKAIYFYLLGFMLSVIFILISLYKQNFGYAIAYLMITLLFMYLIEKKK